MHDSPNEAVIGDFPSLGIPLPSEYYQPPTPSARFNLFGLPIEVRLQIYSEMVEPYILTYNNEWGDNLPGTAMAQRRRAHIPLYSICRETREIAKAQFGDTDDPPFDPSNDMLRLQITLPWDSHLSSLLPPE